MTTMRDLIAGLPGQLRWAADLDPGVVGGAGEILVSGMGGSGMAGTVASVVAACEGGRISVHRSYGLPLWAPAASPLVVAVSHSGDTEETVSTAEAAVAAGLPLAGVGTGGEIARLVAAAGGVFVTVPPGPQPRAALGYLTGGVLRLAEAAGVVGPQGTGLREAADVVEQLYGDGAGPAAALAADLADALAGRVVVVYGGHGVASAAAARWKAQINENAKCPAFWGEIPEIDHNEVEAWSARSGFARRDVGVVWLHDDGAHARIAVRDRVTASVLDGRVTTAGAVNAAGSGPLARLYSLILVGDLVSIALAERAGVDPMPVPVIESLKTRLASEEP